MKLTGLLSAAAAGAATIASALPQIHNVQDISARQTAALPTSFSWTSTSILITPKNDTRNIAGIKDPSIIEVNGTYHVFASVAKSEGYNLVYLNFTSFDDAESAPHFYLDGSGIGTGYRAAPEVFYFAPHKLWYLIFQNGNAAYSTNPDISNPAGWTAPKNFYADTPTIIAEHLGDQGYWVDMWVICDASDCHLFSSDDMGQLYRSQTPLADFPNGMSDPVIALQDERFALFEASNVYKVDTGSSNGTETYLLLVEAIGTDSQRYFRSWTSSSIAGPWIPLAASEENPFARSNNVVFDNQPAWTKSISHGEVVRDQVDQTLTISPCNLRYLYQGMDPAATGDYNSLPWRLALLTQVGGC